MYIYHDSNVGSSTQRRLGWQQESDSSFIYSTQATCLKQAKNFITQQTQAQNVIKTGRINTTKRNAYLEIIRDDR